MRQHRHSLRGLSLFEVMLVLLIASMLAVAALKYAQRDRQVASDQLYGMNLYAFGQAVQQYVTDANLSPSNTILPGPAAGNKNGGYTSSPVMLTTAVVGGNTQITATGVDWLKQVNTGLNPSGGSYVSDTFSFATNMHPLTVALPDPATGAATTLGDAAFKTVITITATGPQIKIIAPVLYEAATAGIDPKTHQPFVPVLMPSLTQDAVQRANTYFDANGGAPAIIYAYPYINNTGVVTPGAQITGGPNPASTGDYLRRDGSNTMLGTLAFDVAATSKLLTGAKTVTLTDAGSVINNVDTMQFNPTAPSNGTIAGLNMLTFSPQANKPSSIQGLNQIKFQTVQSNPTGVGMSAMADLATLNFDNSSAAVKGTISFLKNLGFLGQSWASGSAGDGNVSQILDLDQMFFNRFTGDIVFKGVDFADGIGAYYAGVKPGSGMTNANEVCVNSTVNTQQMALPSNAFCFISHIEWGANNSGRLRQCYVNNGTHVLKAAYMGTCCAQCFYYQ